MRAVQRLVATQADAVKLHFLPAAAALYIRPELPASHRAALFDVREC